MKKELLIALPLALGAPYAAAGTCSVSTTKSKSTQTTCTTGNLDNLRSSVTLQVSSGVKLQAEDGDSVANVAGNDIAISSCHTSGNAYYFGDTGGGSVRKNEVNNTNNFCNSPVNYGTAANS